MELKHGTTTMNLMLGPQCVADYYGSGAVRRVRIKPRHYRDSAGGEKPLYRFALVALSTESIRKPVCVGVLAVSDERGELDFSSAVSEADRVATFDNEAAREVYGEFVRSGECCPRTGGYVCLSSFPRLGVIFFGADETEFVWEKRVAPPHTTVDFVAEQEWCQPYYTEKALRYNDGALFHEPVVRLAYNLEEYPAYVPPSNAGDDAFTEDEQKALQDIVQDKKADIKAGGSGGGLLSAAEVAKKQRQKLLEEK